MTEKSIANPFLAEEPAHEYFVGREEELMELHRYLDQARGGKPSNLYIVGGGGDGKTSYLLKAVEESRQQGLIAVFLNVDINTSPLALMKLIIESILEEIAGKSGEHEYLRDFKKEGGVPSKHFSLPNGTEVVTKYLKDDFEAILKLCENIHTPAIVICLDEGQNLKIINGNLLSYIRGAVQELGKGFMIILSSLEDIMPDLAEKYVGVDRFFPNQLKLGAFANEDEARQCILRRLKDKPIQFEPEAIDLIIRISGRHPREIIDISHRVFYDAIDSGATVVSSMMVDSAVSLKFRDKYTWLQQTVAKLMPNEKDTLRSLVKSGGRTSAETIALEICDGKENLYQRMATTIKIDFTGLYQYGVCRRVEYPDESESEDEYEIIDPMSVYFLERLLEVR